MLDIGIDPNVVRNKSLHTTLAAASPSLMEGNKADRGCASLCTLANDLPVTRLARRARAGRDGIHGERTHDLACYKLVVQLKLANNDKQKSGAL